MLKGVPIWLATMLCFSYCKSPAKPNSSAELASFENEPFFGGKLDVIHEHELKIEELSGAVIRKSTSKMIFDLWMINDADCILFRQAIAPSGKLLDKPKETDLSKFFSKDCESQWEGLAIDGKDRFFIMREHPPTLTIMNSAFSKIEARLNLDFESADINIKVNENSLGEGLILLKGGHILVAKEKDPMLLIEFGPKGHAPIGVDETTILADSEEWQIPTNERLKPLKIWTISRALSELISDIGDLAVNSDKQIFALSQDSKRIVRLESRLRVTEEKVAPKAYWDLPGRCEFPEGLTFLNKFPVVVSDDKSKTENLFIFNELKE